MIRVGKPVFDIQFFHVELRYHVYFGTKLIKKKYKCVLRRSSPNKLYQIAQTGKAVADVADVEIELLIPQLRTFAKKNIFLTVIFLSEYSNSNIY